MDRSNHYEAAFEAYLQWHRLCYIAVDETRRSMLGEERIKSLDFIVHGEGGARLLVDVARAHAQRRNGSAAMRALEEAERLAPEMIRCHWLARETLRDLLRRERTRMKPSRLDLAARMGLVSKS